MTAFETLAGEFLDSYFRENPTHASGLGVDGYDDLLPDLSAAGFARREEHVDEWMTKFRAIADAELTPEERTDRDLIVSSLRGAQLTRDWQVWRRQPRTYLEAGLSGVFGLFLHRLRPDAELAESAAKRMRAIPGVLAAAKENLDPEVAPRLFAEQAVNQCRSAIAYFRHIAPTHTDDPQARALMAEAGEPAARAYEDFLATLEKLAADARGEYAIGEDLYTSLLREKEMLSLSAPELRERGRDEYAKIDAQMAALSKEMRGTTNWVEVLEELNLDHPPTPEAMRDTYEEWTLRARQFLIDRELVTMPEGERCLVEPSPPFQRPVLAVASYFSPPPFKPSLLGHFMVPFPPDGTSDEEVQKRLESNSCVSIPTTAVHEAYPGHHWHLITAGANPRPARKVFHTSYFSEGWALYSEVMMRDEGFYDDPKHLLGVADARIFRAARIVVDTSLHIGDMGFEEAVTFMREKTGMAEPTARAEVARYCAWPTQASSYLTGSLEIERMQQRWLAEQRGDLRAFHDKIASTGALPLGLAERELFAPAS